MRTFLSFVLGVCALLAALVTVPSLWVSHNIADQDGYVAFAEPIGRDAQFHKVLSAALAETVLRNSPLSGNLKPVATEAIERIANQIADEPGFLAAWNETQKRSHQISFGDPRELPAELDSTSGYAVDLAPLGEFVVDRVNDNLPFAIPAPKQAMIQVNGTPQNRAIERIRETPTYARNGLIAIAVMAGLSLLLARRRSTTLMWLGLGTIAVAGILKLGLEVGVPEVLERNTAPSPFAKALLDIFVERADASFGSWLLILAVGGAGVAVVGAVLRGVSGSRPQAPGHP